MHVKIGVVCDAMLMPTYVAAIASARHLPMSALGVRPDIVCDPELALIRLRQLNACVTPLDKLACLQV